MGSIKCKYDLGAAAAQSLHLVGLFSFFFVFSVAALGPYQAIAGPPLPNPLLSCAFFFPMRFASLTFFSDGSATNGD